MPDAEASISEEPGARKGHAGICAGAVWATGRSTAMPDGFQMELTGERILLREFAEGDVGGLLAVHSDPRVLRYYAPEVGTLEHARMLVEMFIQWANENPRQNFQFAIVDPETNALLGSCGIRRKNCPPNQAEFGIGIDADW